LSLSKELLMLLTMMRSWRSPVVMLCIVQGALIASALAALPAAAQDPRCIVPPFSGAAQPQGTVAMMRIINDGKACGVSHFGVPSEKRNPAQTAKIIHPASHGTVRFVAPRVLYQPEAGYVGEDEFVYEARAKNNQDQPVVLRVKMKVVVLPVSS
jgi:hypothetical protein